ncbi:MAG TPA: TetR family transcriptional regulator [Corynebacterium sp.]|nr:TetR family transcriptional regulator [Corynebacterium sp.]
MGLRERQRAFTEETIRLTAVRLFLKQGSRATTVEEIAELAGISARTFFRYFDTKEFAALPSLVPFSEAVAQLSPADGSLPGLVAAVDDAIVSVIEEATVLDAPASRDFFLLLERDAPVRTAAGALYVQLTDILLTSLHRAAPETDPLILQLLAGNRVAALQAVWLHSHRLLHEAGWDSTDLERPAAAYRRALHLLPSC